MVGPTKVGIWKVDLRGSQGHEQAHDRPAIIWKDLDHVKMAIAIPLTKRLEREDWPYTCSVVPSHKNGLSDESIALIFQIRSLDKKRLLKELGELEEEDIRNIAVILRDMLKL